MPSDYMNPGSGLPPQTVQDSGFWSGWNQGEANRIMTPFRENALGQQDLELQKARMQFGEFSSPESIAGRKQGIAAQQANDTATVQEQPAQSQYNIMKHQELMKTYPYETQAKIAELTQKYNDHKGKPEGVVFDALSDAAVQVEKADPMMREGIYKGLVEQISRSNPGVHIPERFKSYNPQGQKELQFGHMARVNSVAQKQKEQAKAAEDKAHMERTNAEISGRNSVANIQQTGENTRAANKAEVEKNANPGQDLVNVNRLLGNPAKLAKYAKDSQQSEAEARDELTARKSGYQFTEAMKIANAEVTAMAIPIIQGKDTQEKIIRRSLARQGVKFPGEEQGSKTSLKDTARPGEEIQIDKNGIKAVLRNGKWVEVH